MKAPKRPSRRPRIAKVRLAEMIEEATVDAHGESEQVTGWFTAIGENLAVRGRSRQLLAILDLPLPSPPVDGAEWIEAYRLWRRGG